MAKCKFHPIEVRVRVNCSLSTFYCVKFNKSKNNAGVFLLKINIDDGSERVKIFAQVSLISLNHQKGPTSMLKFEI